MLLGRRDELVGDDTSTNLMRMNPSGCTLLCERECVSPTPKRCVVRVLCLVLNVDLRVLRKAIDEDVCVV